MTPAPTTDSHRQIQDKFFDPKRQTRFAAASRLDRGSKPARDHKPSGYDSSFLADRGQLTGAEFLARGFPCPTART